MTGELIFLLCHRLLCGSLRTSSICRENDRLPYGGSCQDIVFAARPPLRAGRPTRERLQAPEVVPGVKEMLELGSKLT